MDQIAAGEVVERPASVAKELVENAVDAGASRIRVELRDGGVGLIAVTDDGCGMSPDDAQLALERHATSKLRALADLQDIASFGFRGEALPSIASVSRLRLLTRERGSDDAFEILVEGGRRIHARVSGGPVGTRVEVAELFAQVPVRRKFLKSAATEWGHVSDWLARAALATPAVHFDVVRDGRSAIHWPAVSDPLDRVAAVLSDREAASLRPGSFEAAGVSVRAFASHPAAHRATAAGLHLFVNGRPVRDRLLRHAILQVYRDVLPRGRFPTVLVYLSVPPGGVDVNVHPAKWEVRFADPQSVHRAVRAALGQVMQERAWLGGSEGPVAAPGRLAEGPDAGTGDWVFARQGGPVASEADGDRDLPLGGVPALPEATRTTPPLRFGALHLLGQLLATYLLVEEKDGLVLVDQHAAHERVLYERLRAAWLAGGVERQALLLPFTLELDPPRQSALLEAGERVAAIGFEVEPFGEGAVRVRAVPALLADRDPAGLLRGLADEIQQGAVSGAAGALGTRDLDRADQLFASMACHAARRAGEVLAPAEQRALLEALDTIPFAPTCPHGRPVALPIAREEIERRFRRR